MELFTEFDIKAMQLAIQEAGQGAIEDEVPVGAVLVYEGKIIASDHNRNIQGNDSTAHAEILVLRKACELLNQKRLDGAWIYVTKEPCPMCAGALVLAHIDRLFYGISDDKMGCAGTIINLVDHPRFNHRMEIQKGLLAEECLRQLQSFFQNLRKRM
jgi:tRNA(adenine34) deaminase